MTSKHINKTGEPQVIAARNRWLTITVPIRIKRRSGRRLVTLPSGENAESRSWDGAPTPLQLALARRHRWLAMLESGVVKLLRQLTRGRG